MGNRCYNCANFVNIGSHDYCISCYYDRSNIWNIKIPDDICFVCNKNNYCPWYINGLKYCSNYDCHIQKYIKLSILEQKHKKIYIRTVSNISCCSICEHKIEEIGYLSTFHHCFIPIKNKYINVNIL